MGRPGSAGRERTILMKTMEKLCLVKILLASAMMITTVSSLQCYNCGERKDENGKTNYTELIGKHGCGADIGEIEGRHHYCSEHPDSCFNVDDSTFPSVNETAVVTNIEVCFCSTDRCNEEDPIFPEPAPGGSSPTIASIVLVSLGAVLVGAN